MDLLNPIERFIRKTFLGNRCSSYCIIEYGVLH